MIIVEGFDNTGKSTLVKRLAKDLKLLTINNQRRPADIHESFRYLDGVLYLASGFPVIVDRWQPISEPIYGPICRGTNMFSAASLERQLRMTLSANPLIIYCRPPDPIILGFGEREQMDGVIDNAPKLLSTYDTFMGNLTAQGFSVVSYDWTTDPYEHLINLIRNHHEN